MNFVKIFVFTSSYPFCSTEKGISKQYNANPTCCPCKKKGEIATKPVFLTTNYGLCLSKLESVTLKKRASLSSSVPVNKTAVFFATR